MMETLSSTFALMAIPEPISPTRDFPIPSRDKSPDPPSIRASCNAARRHGASFRFHSTPISALKKKRKIRKTLKSLSKPSATACILASPANAPMSPPTYPCTSTRASAATAATSGATSGPLAPTVPTGAPPARPPTVSEDRAALPYTHISTAPSSWFIVPVDILWRVSVADCLFVTDCSLYMHNPLLAPRFNFLCTHWLHRTLFLATYGRHIHHLIIVFPSSTLRVTSFTPFLTRFRLSDAPPTIRPPAELRRLLRRF